MLYAGLLLSIFLDYVRPASYLPVIGALKLNSMVPLLVLAGSIIYKGPIDNPSVFSHTNTRWVLFFMFLLMVSVLTADVTLFSYNIFINVLGFVFWFYIITRVVTSREKLKGLFIVFVISHVVVLFLNPQIVLNPAVRSYIYGNPFLGDGNDFALSVCIVIPMSVYLIFNTRNIILKSVFIAALIVLVFGVIGTQSRGATIAMACVMLYMWWAGRKKVMGLLVLAALVGVVLSYAPPAYFNRMNSIANYENEGSAQGRIIAWKTAIRMLKAYPVTGVGSGHFAVKLGTEFRPPEYGNLALPWLTAHSLYFLVIGELGIPGIMTIFVLLIGNFLRNSRLLKEARGSPDPKLQSYQSIFLTLNGSLLAFAVGGAFLSVAYYPHMYVLAGIFTAAHLMFLYEGRNGIEVQEESKSTWYENDPERAVWDDDSNNSGELESDKEDIPNREFDKPPNF